MLDNTIDFDFNETYVVSKLIFSFVYKIFLKNYLFLLLELSDFTGAAEMTIWWFSL